MGFQEYFDANRLNWNQRTLIHIDSDLYEMQAFRQGQSSLRQLELAEIGEVRGKSLLHLQCHFGQDTLSWARLGAQVWGMDFSEQAINYATQLADELALDAKFVCCDVYQLPQHLDQQFDIVFTSYGTIGWLPDLDQWASVIRHFLKPGGTFYIAEFHPLLWMYDEQFEQVIYSYFNEGPDYEVVQGTYTDPEAPIQGENYYWSHSISEVVMALKNAGLELTFLHEHNYINWNCVAGLEEVGPYQYILPKWGHKAPYMFSIKARLPV